VTDQTAALHALGAELGASSADDRDTRGSVAEAVQHSDGDSRSAGERAAHGIYRAGLDGRFLTVNPALVSMLGYDSEEELLALSVERDVYPDSETGPALRRRYEHAERIVGLELDWKRKNGQLIKVRLSGWPVRAEDGALECFDMIAEDLSSQRRLEAQLRQAQKMEAIGQLTAGIAHDFSNVLTVIMSNAELIADSLPKGAHQAREDLQELIRAGERGAAMVRRLLKFGRSEQLELKATDPGHLVTDVSQAIRRLLPEHVAIEVATEDSAGTVQVDAGAVEQVLLNLATNARDAMPEGGLLRIEVARTRLDEGFHATHPWVTPGEHACITVSDTGVGMDEETKSRLFEPFYTTKGPDKGTGLGMAMVYGIVKQHRGHVHVYSERGEGTVVKLYFPVVTPEARPEAASAPSKDQSSAGGGTILVVDDEVSVRRAMKRALEAHGYAVMSAADGEEALEIIGQNAAQVDLIIADMVMPKLGGRQLYDALTQREIDINFLFTSGYSAKELEATSGFPPAVQFLSKPWVLSDLLQSVRKALRSTENG
jgi:PAS domain S-box-containing protein